MTPLCCVSYKNLISAAFLAILTSGGAIEIGIIGNAIIMEGKLEWEDKRKTKNNVFGLEDYVHVVEGESWTSWRMTSLDVPTFPGSQRTKEY